MTPTTTATAAANSNFDPMSIDRSPTEPTTAGVGHNRPANELIFEEINDLYDECKNWADGEPITSEAMADAVTDLRTRIHDAGKRADELRKEEKRPLDDQIKALQDTYNPFIQPRRGKVDMAKSALDDLLTPWRNAKAKAAAEEARRQAEEAAAAREAANAAMQASAGNLAEREAAEEALADAKKLEKTAKRADKAATTGTGLRTTWEVTLVDEDAAMEWCWARAKDEVLAVAQRNAEECVRAGVRSVPGFSVEERKVAR